MKIFDRWRLSSERPYRGTESERKTFIELFQSEPEDVPVSTIMDKLWDHYDRCKEILVIGRMEENHHGDGYFARSHVRDWEHWRSLYSNARDRLQWVLFVVQPFIQEDLGPIEGLTRDTTQVASRRVIRDEWMKGSTSERYAHLAPLVSGGVHRKLESEQ